MRGTGLTRVEHGRYSHPMTQMQQASSGATLDTPREYVVRFNYGDGDRMAVCTTERMAKSIENAHYSGDTEDQADRYFSFMVDRTGRERFVEVVFKCIRSDRADDDDYLYSRWGVFRKDSGPDAKPFDFFTVRIDGRA